jgi:hypothetical protein
LLGIVVISVWNVGVTGIVMLSLHFIYRKMDINLLRTNPNEHINIKVQLTKLEGAHESEEQPLN